MYLAAGVALLNSQDFSHGSWMNFSPLKLVSAGVQRSTSKLDTNRFFLLELHTVPSYVVGICRYLEQLYLTRFHTILLQR